jgi:hypothetical protein
MQLCLASDLTTWAPVDRDHIRVVSRALRAVDSSCVQADNKRARVEESSREDVLRSENNRPLLMVVDSRCDC